MGSPFCPTASAVRHGWQARMTQAVTTAPWTRPRSRTSTATTARLGRRDVVMPSYRGTNRIGCQKTSLTPSVETQVWTIHGPGQASNRPRMMKKTKLWQKRKFAWQVKFLSAFGWCKFRIDVFFFFMRNYLRELNEMETYCELQHFFFRQDEILLRSYKMSRSLTHWAFQFELCCSLKKKKTTF